MTIRRVRILLGWVGMVAFGAFGAAHATVLPGPLVTPQWLHAHADDVQIVDIRDDLNSLTDKSTFSTVNGKKMLDRVGGHIFDALSVNFWALREKRDINGKQVNFLLPTAEEFQAVMQASQLEHGKPIVLAPTGDDATSLQEAAFLAYELQLFGEPADHVAILDGGTHAWIMAGYEVDIDAIAPMDSGHWTAKPPRADMMADIAQVQAAQRGHKLLLDARPLAQFAGLDRTPVIPVKGRIAGSSPLPAELLYSQAADGSWRFLKAAQYKKVLALGGVRQVAPAIIYCNTGQYASGAWFVLDRIMGLKGLREYQGGMNEWVNRKLPVVTL